MLNPLPYQGLKLNPERQILVYGLKMADNVGAGKERVFIVTWLESMLFDNLLFQWQCGERLSKCHFHWVFYHFLQ